MSKGYDGTFKQLVEAHPADWLILAGLPAGHSVEVVDSELSSVTAAADKVLRISGPDPYIAHLEFQAGVDPNFDSRMLLYNVPARWRHRLPVRTVAVLLHPGVETSGIAERVQDIADAESRLEFSYRILRVWTLPVKPVLEGGVGTLPLAPLCVSTAELPAVFERIDARLSAEAPPRAEELWTASFVLSGLRHDASVVKQVLEGVRTMRESSTYQYILQEGRLEEARKLILKLGTKRFGPPGRTVELLINEIDELERLEGVFERMPDATGWDDLFSAVAD